MTARQLLGDLLQRLWRDLVRYLLPKRRHRTNPRVVKRKMSKFCLKRPEHYWLASANHAVSRGSCPYLKGLGFKLIV
jgi:hypothetical protein